MLHRTLSDRYRSGREGFPRMPQAMAIPLMIFPIVHPGKEQFGCRKRIRDLSLSRDYEPVLHLPKDALIYRYPAGCRV